MRTAEQMQVVQQDHLQAKVSQQRRTSFDRHHAFWPRRLYQTRLERDFRGLPCVLVDIDYESHKTLHHSLGPPAKPESMAMEATVTRHQQLRCGCYRRQSLAPADLLEVAGLGIELPCLKVTMDVWALRLLGLQFRSSRRNLPPEDRINQLQCRHEERQCACFRPILHPV